jgi:hypothetical protein
MLKVISFVVFVALAVTVYKAFTKKDKEVSPPDSISLGTSGSGDDDLVI